LLVKKNFISKETLFLTLQFSLLQKSFNDIVFLLNIFLKICHEQKDYTSALKILYQSRHFYRSRSNSNPVEYLSDGIGKAPIWKQNEFWNFVFEYEINRQDSIGAFETIALICQSMLNLRIPLDYATTICITLASIANLKEQDIEDLLVLIPNMSKGIL
jgi:hypothetical protein